MRKERKMKNKVNNINKMLEMPKEVYTNEPKITIIGFNEMIIENYKGILEYEEYYVKVNTYIGILNINGVNLKLEKMTEEELNIIGKIEKTELERTID